jgi:undecaprenyl-diphosphatase
MLAVIVYGLGAFLLSRRLARPVRVLVLAAAAILIVVIGISRVYLGAHWPSDVIAAAFAGLAWAAVGMATAL